MGPTGLGAVIDAMIVMVVFQQTADLRRSTLMHEIDQSSLAEQAGAEVGADIPGVQSVCK
jgi:hypothetical protein